MKATAKEKQLLSDSIVNDRLEVVRLKARILELEEELRAGGLRRSESE
ncbi:MAG: hypothetical protein LN413_00105 [Candidatus Thermoplasmatota archaeon]|nr:hypothetical protein [Candidatus Thermoplasmatota archaeon]